MSADDATKKTDSRTPSLLHRAAKHWATKTAGTNLVNAVVKSVVKKQHAADGDDDHDDQFDVDVLGIIDDLLKNFETSKIDGSDKDAKKEATKVASERMRQIKVFIAKGELARQNNQINPDQSRALPDSLMALSDKLFSLIRPTMMENGELSPEKDTDISQLFSSDEEKSDPEQAGIDAVVAQGLVVAQQIQDLMHDAMQPKNRELLQDLMKYLCDPSFVTFFASAEGCADGRKIVCDVLASESARRLGGQSSESDPLRQMKAIKGDILLDKYSAVVDTVQEFWRNTAAPRRDEIQTAMMAFWVEKEPEAKSVAGGNREKQTEMLMTMMEDSMQQLGDLHTLLNTSRADRAPEHKEAGLTPPRYNNILPAWHHAFETVLASEYSRRYRKCFAVIFTLILDALKEGQQ
jgi:hypothetical protein